MSFRLPLLFVMLFLLVGGVVALGVAAKRLRLRFSLRTLLIFITLVALALGTGSWWLSLDVAKTTWLAPSPAAARQVEPTPVIVPEGDEFKLTFSTKRRQVQELTDTVRERHGEFPGDRGYRWDHQRHQVEITAEDEAALEARAHALEAADVLQPGTFVIRGRVEDRKGRPVPDAIVDLMGGYVYINHFQTRADGTFTMPIKAPPRDGYYLRIRYRDDKRMRTPRFSLSASEPERVVLIRQR